MPPQRRSYATAPALVAAIELVAEAVGIDVHLDQVVTGTGPTPTPGGDDTTAAPAAGTSQLHHTHFQDEARTEWPVTSPLRYRPAAIRVVDDWNNPWWPEVVWIDDQHLLLRFPTAVRGRVDLS